MKKRKYGYILLASLVVFGLAGTTFDNSLNKKERKTLVSELKDSKTFFLRSVKGLSDAQLDHRVAPGKWTVRECAEHIALSEGLLFQMIGSALKQQATPLKRNEIKFTDDELSIAVRDRSKKAQAPEVIQPKGKFKSMDALLTDFTKNRNDHINYVKITTEDLRNHVSPHPFFGQLDCYQWMLLMSAHTKRHTDQILEILADPGFPKK